MQVTKRVAEAERYLRRVLDELPVRAVLLDSGMGGFSGELTALTVIPQQRIPGFPEPRRGEPGGRVLFGRLGGVPTAVVEGRRQLYAGYLPGECACAARTLAALGARSLLLVAAGSALEEETAAGTMFLVADRIDLTGVAHLKGIRDAPGGPFPEISPPAPGLGGLAAAAGASAGVPVAAGVAALVHGPLRPSPAERRAMRTIGAGAVSMALASELAAAAAVEARVAAFLLIGGAWEARHLEFCRLMLESWAPIAGLDEVRAPA